jgi:hypothetical protein
MSLNKYFSFPVAPKDPNGPVVLGPLQFRYKGVVYECVGDGCYFEFMQFEHLIETQDWVTLKNRIINQTIDHGTGVYLKIIQ